MFLALHHHCYLDNEDNDDFFSFLKFFSFLLVYFASVFDFESTTAPTKLVCVSHDAQFMQTVCLSLFGSQPHQTTDSTGELCTKHLQKAF